METPTERLTEKQARYIRSLIKKLDWDADLVSAWLNDRQTASIADLSKKEAAKAIADLLYYLQLQQPGAWEGKATSKQAYAITAKWKANDQAGDTKYLGEFLQKRWNVSDPRQLTCQQADTCIKMLDKVAKQNRQRAGKTTVLKRKKRCSHCGQMVLHVVLPDGKHEYFDFSNNNKATAFHECKAITIPGYGAGC